MLALTLVLVAATPSCPTASAPPCLEVQTTVVIPPPRLRAIPGMLPPPGYQEVSRPRTGLALAGGITLGASWMTNAVFMTTIFRTPEAMVSLIPLVGPVIWSLQHVHEWAGSLALLWGVVASAPQIAGLIMLVAGLSPRQEWVLVGDPTNPSLTIGLTPAGIGGRF